MSDQHVKAVVSKAVGTIEAEVGKATGDPALEAKGKARQVKGAIQEGVGDVSDEVRKVMPRR